MAPILFIYGGYNIKMNENNQYNTSVNSTEEYRLLVDQIKTQGGHVVHTFSLRDKERGISVQYMIPVSKQLDE